MPEFISPVDISPGSTGWTEVDVSGNIPAGSTGVILHFENTSTTFSRYSNCRKKGSTDDRTSARIGTASHHWRSIGVDSNRKLEVYISSTNVKVYLEGYYGSEAVFFDNGEALTVGGSWGDVDISSHTGADTAIAAILEIGHTDNGDRVAGARKNGSTDDHTKDTILASTGSVVGVDGSETFEAKGGASAYMYLSGYIKSGASFYTNAVDITPETTGEWTALGALPFGAKGAFIHVHATGSIRGFGLRKKGQTNLYTNATRYWAGCVVGCDNDGIIEAQIQDDTVKIYLLGYATDSGLSTSKKLILATLI